MNYTVIVSDLGFVYRGNSHRFALTSYNFYKNNQKNVMLFKRDVVAKEFNKELPSGEAIYMQI